MRIQQNIFTVFLNLLKVKHTKEFSSQYFNEHPHKNNLFGLSKMLSDYGVENAGTQIVDKENDIYNIELPFIAHIGGFVAVYKVESQKVHYIWNGKKIILPISQFIQSWSGIILLAETTPNSIEPDYKVHRKKKLFGIAQKSIVVLAGILIFAIAYINHSLYANFGISLLLLINLIGSYVSYLLVLKQMHIHSQYADKICSLFSKSDCNNVLEMDAAKLWGIFGWSEIEQTRQEINSIKANEDVFRTLLTQQPRYEVSKSDSQIIFGTPDSELKVTVFTNPFCNPCAKMHKRIEKLLKDTKREICIQYIFSSFQPDLDYANKYLIAAWLISCHCVPDTQSPEQIITDWFEKSKDLKEKFFENLQLDMSNPDIDAEFQKHEAWKAKTQLRATPTILVDGYKLPDNYKIEDLKYFFNLDL